MKKRATVVLVVLGKMFSLQKRRPSTQIHSGAGTDQKWTPCGRPFWNLCHLEWQGLGMSFFFNVEVEQCLWKAAFLIKRQKHWSFSFWGGGVLAEDVPTSNLKQPRNFFPQGPSTSHRIFCKNYIGALSTLKEVLTLYLETWIGHVTLCWVY